MTKNFELHEAVLASDYERLRSILGSGQDLDGWDSHGMTPLLWAVWRGDLEAVRILLSAGVDPNKQSSQNTSPLWHAAEDFGLLEIADLLREHGARRDW